MARTKEEMAKVAAEWWANAFKHPRFDNGDNSNNGGIVMMLGIMNSKVVDDETAEKFQNELATRIEEQLTGGHMWIEVDYHPDPILAEAAEATGMPITNAPWKTSMAIDVETGVIRVSSGYGAPWVDV